MTVGRSARQQDGWCGLGDRLTAQAEVRAARVKDTDVRSGDREVLPEPDVAFGKASPSTTHLHQNAKQPLWQQRLPPV